MPNPNKRGSRSGNDAEIKFRIPSGTKQTFLDIVGSQSKTSSAYFVELVTAAASSDEQDGAPDWFGQAFVAALAEANVEKGSLQRHLLEESAKEWAAILVGAQLRRLAELDGDIQNSDGHPCEQLADAISPSDPKMVEHLIRGVTQSRLRSGTT